MAFVGQPLSLSVEMCANPMPERAFWIFGSVALRPGSRHRNKYVAQKLSVSAFILLFYLCFPTQYSSQYKSLLQFYISVTQTDFCTFYTRIANTNTPCLELPCEDSHSYSDFTSIVVAAQTLHSFPLISIHLLPFKSSVKKRKVHKSGCGLRATHSVTKSTHVCEMWMCARWKVIFHGKPYIGLFKSMNLFPFFGFVTKSHYITSICALC